MNLRISAKISKKLKFWIPCCSLFFFKKNTCLLLNFFQKLISLKIVACKPLLIKKNYVYVNLSYV